METKPVDVKDLADDLGKAIENEIKTKSKPADPASTAPRSEDAALEAVPDPEEDDLDDLDGKFVKDSPYNS